MNMHNSSDETLRRELKLANENYTRHLPQKTEHSRINSLVVILKKIIAVYMAVQFIVNLFRRNRTMKAIP